MLEKEVKINISGNQKHAHLSFKDDSLKLTYLRQEWVSHDSIPFIALKKLRAELEEANIFILINGSRKDVYPSGMQMNMGMTSAYINSIGKGGGLVIDIFEDCDDIRLIETVDSQELFHKNWLRSLE